MLPLREQGMRPTCMAFAFSELHQFAKTLSEHLSAEYLYRAAARRMHGWVPDAEGLSLGSGVQALAGDGQPPEVACPYRPSEPTENPPILPGLGAAAVYRATSNAAWMDVDAITDRIKDGKL